MTTTPATNPPRCPQCGALPGCAARPCPVCAPTSPPDQPMLPGFRAIFRHSLSSEWGEERLLVLGAQPLVLIEPEFGDSPDEVLNFVVDATDLAPLELADLLCVLADTLRAEEHSL